MQSSLCVVGRLGRGKKKARDDDAAIAIFFPFKRYSAGAYAEENVLGQLSLRLLTKEQLNLPLVYNKVY